MAKIPRFLPLFIYHYKPVCFHTLQITRSPISFGLSKLRCGCCSLHIYSVEGTDLCLASTVEIPLGGMHMDSMLPEASLPLKLVAFSHCFRTEASAAGAATRLVLACFTIHLELECPLAFFLVRIIILSMI